MDDKTAVRRGYDELAEVYAARRSHDDRELAALDEFLDSLSEPTRVLDAGCGQGTPVLRRVAEATTAVGVDFSRVQLELAAEAVPTALLVHGDMTALPFRDDAFDGVVAYDSVIHVPLADHQTVIDEFARVLRPGSRVLLSEAPEERRRTKSDWLDGDVEMTWHMAGAEATREQLRNAGFRIVTEWEPTDASAGDGPKPPFFAARLDPSERRAERRGFS